MGKRYTLTDCYELLQVDPKTFRRWIDKAGIVPQVSKADDRVKYLTQEQLEELAELHERPLPESLPRQEASMTPGSYKLLVEQIDELNHLQDKTWTLAIRTEMALTEQGLSLGALLETVRASVGMLETSLEEQEQRIAERLIELAEATNERFEELARGTEQHKTATTPTECYGNHDTARRRSKRTLSTA
jgi:hypothetical protein